MNEVVERSKIFDNYNLERCFNVTCYQYHCGRQVQREWSDHNSQYLGYTLKSKPANNKIFFFVLQHGIKKLRNNCNASGGDKRTITTPEGNESKYTTVVLSNYCEGQELYYSL